LFVPPEIQNFYRKDPGKSLTVYKSGLGSQAYIAQELLNKGRDVVVILPDENSLFEFKEIVRLLDTSSLQGQDFWNQNWMFLPGYRCQGSGKNDWAQKWTALFKLLHGPQPKAVALTLDNLLPLWPSPKQVENQFLFLMRNEEFSWEEIQDKLIIWGYTHVSLVTRPGEFSRRGDILDIYSPGYDYPLRLEFFGDHLESLRLFEPVTQRSKSELQEAVVLPISPVIFEERLLKQAREYWNYLWKTGLLSKKDKSSLEQKVQEGDHGILPGLFYSRKVSISGWLPTDPVFIVKEADKIRSNLEEGAMNWKNFLVREKQDSGYAWPEEAIAQSVGSAREVWINQAQILFEDLPVGSRKQGIELPEKKFDNFGELFWQPEQKNRPLKALLSALSDWRRTKNQVVLGFKSDNSRKKFRQLVEDADVSIVDGYNPQKKGIYTDIASLEYGLQMEWNHVMLLSEEVLHPRQGGKRKKRISDEQFDGLQTYEDIKKDDLLVHRDYGLGRFAGLTRLQANNTGNDYLVLDYAGGDKLYVPVDKLNLIQKYKGPEGAAPALDKLGGSGWNKAKEKARKALQEIAHDLVEMYAYRSVAKGYSYSPPEDLYKEFEATFDFEETADQEQAIKAVQNDMDSPEPMDRLVCGDSGFGKTEVAIRAAFRAVISGKQVCLLCPTTVLAEQHYQNFQKRMEGFPVRIAMISRFISAKEQKKIIASAENGEIDILIGTHRVLSNDVYMPRLSLFILDEEQRFGVRHKEKLKQIRQNIDVLTLTATPIPRTLQLSLSGIRQLSLIETPPQERKAVQSALVERDPEMLKGILQQELDRNGQVFWVYNRVKGLERVKEYVQSLVPGARVGMAHGQMSEKRLEENMHLFWHGELDVLVTTAIIESGLDFPNANTLVVDQAQMFGLGQLYQLRGRVGRSSEQAFAYFVVPSREKLPSNTAKRMQTILDMDYLGAGFQVAREDLRLRGAGNILGEVQSGSINKIGLDLFLEMLEQEVRRVKGQPLRQETEPELNITFEANIPGDYIADPELRLHYYKELVSSKSDATLDKLLEEIRDRFGHPPVQVDNLAAVIKLKRQMSLLQVERADLYSGRIVVHWSENVQPVDPQIFINWMEENQEILNFNPPAKLELRPENKDSIVEVMFEAKVLLEKLRTTSNTAVEV